METWIIADDDQLAARIRETLQHLAIDCPASRILRIESVGPQGEAIAGFDGLVFFAAGQLEPAHLEFIRQIRSVVDDGAKIVAVASVRDHGTVLTAIRAGASDFLNAAGNLHD